MYVCMYIYTNRKVVSSLQFDQIQTKLKNTSSYVHRRFRIALNCFSTVKPLNFAIVLTKN